MYPKERKKQNKKTNVYFSNVSKLSTIHEKQNQSMTLS